MKSDSNINYIMSLLEEKFKNIKINIDNIEVLNLGKFANAYVYRYEDRENDIDLTIKDFYHCPLPVRQTLGRFMPKVEFNTIKKLEGIHGIAPDVFLLSPYTVAFSFVKGDPIKAYGKKNKTIPVEFFIQLEESIRQMHHRDIVHLDLRNFGNILRGEDDLPYIIDFQSSISTRLLPSKIRGILEDSDISGVYKAWKALGGEPLPKDKEVFLEEFNALRKFWILKGYPITRSFKWLKNKIKGS